MDQIFSHIADQISLSGPSGILLTLAITAVLPNPRPSLTTYLRHQFEQIPLFTVTPKDADVLIIAHPNLRRRALGFSPIEQPSLPQPAWVLLEAIGRAGPSGLLQSSLGKVIGLQANMVHHYIGLLSARRLIGKRKTVFHHPQSDGGPVSVTYTSVIVLARYAAQIMDPLSQTDTASDVRLQRMLNALRQPPYVRPERDLKIIAIPDSERPSSMTRELFQRRRHRSYRSLRTKLIRLGVAAFAKRKCVTQNGRVLGSHPCLKLLEHGKKQFDTAAKERRVSHPLLAGGGDRFVAEVDVVEQVYRMLVEAGPSGISVPELHQYLDTKGITSAPSKRIRSIINAISKVQPTVERQYFEGSAMYLRISLQYDNEPFEKRRKIGVTALGERRQEIVMDLLQDRKVLIMESLGREIARVEDGSILRVDPKVLRRLISDLVAQKRVKLITTARPTIKDNPRSQTLVLVALPDVDERGDIVRNVVTTVVNRSLYGIQDDARDSATKRARDGEMKATGKVRKRIARGEEDDDSAEESRREGKRSKTDRKNEEDDEDEEPVVMYQASDSDDVSEDEQSADEKGTEEEGSETQIGRMTTAKGRKTTSSRKKQMDKSPNAQGKQGKESLKTRKKKVSLREEEEKEASTREEKEASTKKAKKKTSRKRKNAEEGDKKPSKRSKAEKKGSVKTKKSETGQPNRVPADGQGVNGDDDATILIKSQPRNLRGSRILRLRAVDYGCLKGKLARVRRFHKNLYEIIRTRNGDDLQVTPGVQHVTMESAREAPLLGRFSFLSVLKGMTVGEYAATVGIYQDHGDTIKQIEREKIYRVLDVMKDEITSNTASRQVQQFVQTMTKLELIQSDVDSQWLLTGAGIIRDFGRGLPSGVVPHGIIFSSFKAVEEYWLEVEQFSRCRMSRKPITIDLRNEENVKQVETHPVGDLYFPKRWGTGIHRLQKHEQLEYETILQRLSGVQIVLENNSRLRTDNFIKGRIRRFEVEELDTEMEGVMKKELKGGKPQLPKRGVGSEQLLLYSRFRTANPIPKWFLKSLGVPQNKGERLPDGKNELLEDNSCLLQLTRTSSSIKGQQVRAAMPSVFDANHRRYFKTRAKPKPSRELPPEGRVELKRLIPLIRAILRGRAVAYHRNDAEGLDWKVIPSLARFELQQSTADLREAVERENLRRAVVALCEITTVRAALDILSLKVVLRLHDLSRQMPVNENGEPWSAADVSKTAVDLVSNWDSLDAVCSAIVVDVREDVRYHAQVYIHVDSSLDLHNTATRHGIIKKEFYMAGFLHGRPQSFAHTIEMMASRFRKVADIRLFREARYAVLLSQPYGELSRGEGMLEDRAPIQSGNNGEANATEPNKEKGDEPVVACIAYPSSTGPVKPVDTSRALDQSSDGEGPMSHVGKTSPAITTKEGEGVRTMGNTKDRAPIQIGNGEANAMVSNNENDEGPVACIAYPSQTGPTMTPDPPEESRAVDDTQAFQPVIASKTAGQEDLISTHRLHDAPHCPPELAELVVCAVIRQPPHAQWKADCLELLSQFREEDLANARDRLILRGSVSVHAEREKAYCCIQPCKNSRPAETMAALRGDMGGQDKWDKELRSAGDGCLENMSVWRDLCSLELPSSFATAYTTSSIFFDSSGLSLIPKFEEDDEATPVAHDDEDEEDEDEDEDEDDVVTRIKLYFQYDSGGPQGSQKRTNKSKKNKKNADEIQNECRAKNLSQEIALMRQKVSHEIAESGSHGILLETLLQRLNPHTDDDKLALAGALNGLLQDGGIRRFAVETNEEEWEMTTGVLYICKVHCGAVSAWRTPNGEVDQQLVEWVRDEVFEYILRTPGCKSEDVIHWVCARHTSLPRRAVADILFSLEGELLRSSITIWQQRWRLLQRRTVFVDEKAIMTWGQRTIQSFRGDATEFHRIENSQWRVRLSNLL